MSGEHHIDIRMLKKLTILLKAQNNQQTVESKICAKFKHSFRIHNNKYTLSCFTQGLEYKIINK